MTGPMICSAEACCHCTAQLMKWVPSRGLKVTVRNENMEIGERNELTVIIMFHISL